MHRNGPHVQQSPSQRQQPPEQQRYYVQHDFEGPAELTTTLAHAISDVTGVDVTDTGFTLNDHVDPEALDRLFSPKADGTPRTNGQVAFTIWGYQTTVYSNGQITIVPPQQTQGPQQPPAQR